MISKEQLADVFSQFGVEYGSRPPHEIADGLLGPELRISFAISDGSGTLIVREKTAADENYDEFESDMKWAVFAIYPNDHRYHPVAGSVSVDELVRDMVTVYTSIAGASVDAESASVEG